MTPRYPPNMKRIHRVLPATNSPSYFVIGYYPETLTVSRQKWEPYSK